MSLLPGQTLPAITALVENSAEEGDFTFFWDDGDGRRGSSDDEVVSVPLFTIPAHQYAQPGSYLVFVEAIDKNGAEGETQLAVNVYETPFEGAIRGPTIVPVKMRQLFILKQRGDTSDPCSWLVPLAAISGELDPCDGIFVTFPNESKYTVSVVLVDELNNR